MQLSNKLLFEQCAQYSLVCVLVKYYFLCNVHSEPVYTFFSHFNMSCHGWWESQLDNLLHRTLHAVYQTSHHTPNTCHTGEKGFTENQMSYPRDFIQGQSFRLLPSFCAPTSVKLLKPTLDKNTTEVTSFPGHWTISFNSKWAKMLHQLNK